ncbi:MFS transporter [Burkholderia gladioli]|uniref:MFS transporter n=1 Tax=Burkholderia gladioli TaxID=28095 RepID=UPI001641E092|nr:MFS transporter [Burkholderia gladioli]MBU9172883.1 MFS transporter [Burkholderia gladioli]MBU9180057.1 MFS transporter [Burkholderia gladioli]MBU9385619.1 MFS transporter [Burkholderia gladioli]MDN7807282.1 MFS transporter [Burkholderia gladioli]
MSASHKWIRIGGSLLAGLFVAYLDRIALSVALPSIAKDFGFAGPNMAATASWTLTAFLIGYAVANVLGGILTRRWDPKYVAAWTFAFWSLATFYVGMTNSIAVLLICRVLLGIGEGIYWPQQSRFATAWFAPNERTKANAVIQYYGQFLALGIGFMLLTPLYDAFGWRVLFYIAGGLGLLVIVPLYLAMLKPQSEAPYLPPKRRSTAPKLTLAALGGPSFYLVLFSYVMQGMLFWGITLWIPLAVKSIGITGAEQGIASALPYLAAVVLAPFMSRISDRTSKRIRIAASALLLPGALLMLLPVVTSGYGKLALITLALGYFASSYTPNIWSILQASVAPEAVGSAAGIMNGIGAGGGGTLAGFLVGITKAATGSFIVGFVLLGVLALMGGVALLIYERHVSGRMRSSDAEAAVSTAR